MFIFSFSVPCCVCPYPILQPPFLPSIKTQIPNLQRALSWDCKAFCRNGSHTELCLLFWMSFSLNSNVSHCHFYFIVIIWHFSFEGLTFLVSAVDSLTLLGSASHKMFWFGMLTFFSLGNWLHEVWETLFFPFKNQNWRFLLNYWAELLFLQ